MPSVADTFPLASVRIDGGPLKAAQDVELAYLKRFEPDRLLAGFRQQAGLPKKAESYAGWETIPNKGHWSVAGGSSNASAATFARVGRGRCTSKRGTWNIKVKRR